MEKNRLRELVEQAKMGNRMAMSSLMAEYRQHVAATCRSVIADEDAVGKITGEVFDTAYERLGELKQPEDFLPWVTQIAKDRCGAIRVSEGAAIAAAGTTALDRAPSGSSALSVPQQAGGLTVPSPSPAAPAKKKKKWWIAAVAAVAVLALAGGAAALFFGRSAPAADGGSAGEDWLDSQPTDSAVAETYAEHFSSLYDVNEDMVVLCDLSGDDVGEMLVLDCSGHDESRLNIYTILPDGTVSRIYDMDETGPMESRYVIGLCRYDGQQCLYELQVDGWTPESTYTETVFCFDDSGSKVIMEQWEGSMAEPDTAMGQFNFSDYEDIREVVRWAYVAFEGEE